MRKVIQISFAAYQGCGLVVLCDDGTMWMNERPHDPNGKVGCDWFQIKPISQDDDDWELSDE